ncbi:ALF repeat-containing protein [Streptomyces sp. NPDC060366]|uniref:ALF repeat-containing protein n=1 Tax=Streptomyces sp. NPDC060366 TaxID=3347105 RepID=UPI00364FB5EF
MRATRAALHVVATALAPALLFSTPAFAAGSTATSMTVTATSETLGDELSEDDLRVAVLRILADEDSGRAVVREANEALDDGTPEALRNFLETGYRLAQAEDDRVAVFRILANPAISDALRAAAEEAVDGAPEELRHFLEVGQYEVDG